MLHFSVINAKSCDILSGFHLKIAHALHPNWWRFQQDNAKYTKAWMPEHQLATIPWPAVTPYLCPIEKIWVLMEMKV